MTDFPTLFIILAGIFLIGLIPIALCALYTACQKHKWCSKLCLWDQRENPNMTTSIELDELTTNIRQQPASRPVSSVLVDISQRNSHCDVISETASDPGMDHINRFLGRSLSDSTANIYDDESDRGVLHIRRALGLMNKADVDPGVAHVRRALNMVNDLRDIPGQSAEGTGSLSASSDQVNSRAGAENPQCVHVRDRATRHSYAGASSDNVEVSPTNDTYDDSPFVEDGDPHHPRVNTIDRLPSYSEALDILAKINEPEEPPPSYDDAINQRVSRTTEV